MCVNIFDNKIITMKYISSTDESYDELCKAKKPVKFRLPVLNESSDSRIADLIAREIEGKLKGVLIIHFSSTGVHAFRTLRNKTNYALVLSQTL